MKTKIALLLLTFSMLNFNRIIAQNSTWVSTPRGTDFIAWVTPEIWSYQDKLDWSDWYAYYYPQATEIDPPSATSTYNCHGYAWHISEGGSPVWIGLSGYDQYPNDVEDVYWTDNSYAETTEPYASKISYYEDNHSAIQTSTQGVYISKWGDKCLMQHARNYGPSGYYLNYRKYYKLNPGIDGISTALCEDIERTFTSNTTISGSTYSWSIDNTLLDYVSGTGTTSYRVKAKSGTGNAWLSLQITTPSGEVATTPNKDVWVGLPGMPTTNPSGYPTIQLDYGDFQLIRLASSPGASSATGEWWSTGSITLSGNPHGSQKLFEATDYGTGNFYVQTTNDCGDSDIGGGTVYVSSGGKRLSSLQIFPNPATYEINVSVRQDKSVTEDTKNITSIRNDFDIVIYNSYGSVIFSGKMYEGNIKINVSGWQKGTYLVNVKNADVSLTGKFLTE